MVGNILVNNNYGETMVGSKRNSSVIGENLL